MAATPWRTVDQRIFMHIAFGNYWLLDQAGGKIPDDTPEIPADFEKKVRSKAEVIRWLKSSLEAVRGAYPNTQSDEDDTIPWQEHDVRRRFSQNRSYTTMNTWAS